MTIKEKILNIVDMLQCNGFEVKSIEVGKINKSKHMTTLNGIKILYSDKLVDNAVCIIHNTDSLCFSCVTCERWE